jgi:hypothetical protein
MFQRLQPIGELPEDFAHLQRELGAITPQDQAREKAKH